MTRFTKIAAATSAALGLTLLAGFAMGGPGHCRDHSPEQIQRFATHMVDDTLDELDATEVQRAKAHELKDELLTEGLTLKAGHDDMKEEFRVQWASDAPDADRLHALVDARLADVTAFAHKAVDAALELHQVLTPDQRAELLEIHDQRAEQRHGRR